VTTPLEQLATELRTARQAGYIPAPDAVARWHTWAEQTLATVRDDWLAEPAFRRRTGASQGWCRRHYAACAAEGMARLDHRHRRWWHRSARAPRPESVSDTERLEAVIVESFEENAA